MATELRATDEIFQLNLPSRANTALWRNNVRTVGALADLSEVEFLMMRGVGVGTLERVKERLASHGLSMPAEPPPPPDPALAAEAEWIGRQLDTLAEDPRLTVHFLASDTQLERRRRAWPMYRWATGAIDDDMPPTSGRGSAYEAYALPGSMELHLEGLNRLAHEELGADCQHDADSEPGAM